jgi:hypothetical protein
VCSFAAIGVGAQCLCHESYVCGVGMDESFQFFQLLGDEGAAEDNWCGHARGCYERCRS